MPRATLSRFRLVAGLQASALRSPSEPRCVELQRLTDQLVLSDAIEIKFSPVAGRTPAVFYSVLVLCRIYDDCDINATNVPEIFDIRVGYFMR